MTTEKCSTCGKVYSPDCDYDQGRCPHRPPMINIQPQAPSANHFYVSIVKSILRIFAGVALIYGILPICGGLLITAEVLGILEEIV